MRRGQGRWADPEVYSGTGGMSCGGAWGTYAQRAALTSVGTGRVTMTVRFDYGPTAAACGGVAGCRLVYDVTCTRVR